MEPKVFEPHVLIIFTKRTNLLDWYGHSDVPENELPSIKRYEVERDVQLVVQVHYTQEGHTYACIKCPINPLPTVGWFRTPTVRVLISALESHGWRKQHTLSAALLRG